MSISVTGSISLSQVRSELGLSGDFSLSSDGARKLCGQAAGAVSLSQARGSTWIGTSTTHLSLTNALGAYTFRYVVAPGVTIGATTADAIAVGSHSAGASIKLDVYGAVRAKGGAGGGYYSAGAAGGTAIAVNTTLPVEITNYGTVYGGGGGGGAGGAGGAGGGGVWTQLNQEGNADTYSLTNPQYFWHKFDVISVYGYWNNVQEFTAYPTTVTSQVDGVYTYYRGNFKSHTEEKGGGTPEDWYGIYRQWTSNNYTSGGAGGNGGGGGRGIGHDGAFASGSGGSSGAAGGTNAGQGGTGGAGGAGASAWGAAGNAGSTGATGASGNNGGGSGGGSGAAGGAAGRYLLRTGGHNCTFNNVGGGATAGTLT